MDIAIPVDLDELFHVLLGEVCRIFSVQGTVYNHLVKALPRQGNPFRSGGRGAWDHGRENIGKDTQLPAGNPLLAIG